MAPAGRSGGWMGTATSRLRWAGTSATRRARAHPRGCAGGDRTGQQPLQGGLLRRVGAAAGGCTLAQHGATGHGPGAEYGRSHQGGQERLFHLRAEPLAGRRIDDQTDLLFFFAGHEQRRLAQPEQRGDGKCQRRGQAEEHAQGAGDVGVQAETHSPSPARWWWRGESSPR